MSPGRRSAAVLGAVLLVGGSAGVAHTASNSLELASNTASYRSVSYQGPSGINLRSTRFAVVLDGITQVDLRFSDSLATGLLGLGRRSVTIRFGSSETTCAVDLLDLRKASCLLLSPENAQRPRPLAILVV